MTKMIRVSDLSPHPRLGADLLPRLTDAEYKGLLASVKEWGIMQPIVYADPWSRKAAEHALFATLYMTEFDGVR